MKIVLFSFLFILLSNVELSRIDVSHSNTPDLTDFWYKASPNIGEAIDSYNGITVFYNGQESNVFGRNITHDDYNLGLKYQCVEFVKRFYYYHYDHKMPDSYGHAKDLFDETLPDRKFNPKRGLYQFINGSEYRPLPGDILIFGPNYKNPYGHAAIVTLSKGDRMEVIHQNVGETTRELFIISEIQERYFVVDPDVKGWMRKG